jgi:uncharacterized protein with HEPN domain
MNNLKIVGAGGAVCSLVPQLSLKEQLNEILKLIVEALNSITKKDPDIVIEITREIICTRNRIIHGFDAISDEKLCSSVLNHLSELQSEINNLPSS